jgi:starch synthase
VVVVTPRYGVSTVPAGSTFWPEPIPAEVGWGPDAVRRLDVLQCLVPVAHAPLPMRVCLLDDPPLFSQRAGLYGDMHGEFGDNPYRFGVLSRGALSVADRVWGPIHSPGGGPDVLHAHDWHAALAIAYARLRMGTTWAALPAVFTIHNLAFQGLVSPSLMPVLGLPDDALRPDLFAHEGAVNFLKGACALADRVLTVSEGYAEEILTLENGCGLDGFLRSLRSRLQGIENGIDVESFDPKTDRHIAARYAREDAPSQRAVCKRALEAELGLSDGGALFAVVSRLAWQKGIDLFLDVVPHIVERGARVALVGTGEEPLEDALEAIAQRFPGRVAARIAFDGALARRLYAGADFLVVPSRFEPCGLTQLYAMRYGAIPVVSPVGGLRDTVTPFDLSRGNTGTGIVASSADAPALRAACDRALALYADRDARAALVARAMTRDSSWARAAAAHVDLYRQLVAARAMSHREGAA